MPRYEHWYRPDRFERGYDMGYPQHHLRFAERPWVGGYREGFQGGSGGVALGTSGEQVWREWADQRYSRDFERQHGRRRPAAYARDYRAGIGYGQEYGRPPATRASAYGSDYGRQRGY